MSRRHTPYRTRMPPPGVRFRGMVVTASGKKGFGFIGRETITQIDGPDFLLPTRDLLIHINENESLPSPIPEGMWITFYVRPKHSGRKGVEVFDAEVEQSIVPS